MKIDVGAVRNCLKSFELEKLFREHLGWDRYDARLDIILDGQTIHLHAFAQKRGMAAYLYFAKAGEQLPDHAMRRKIEHHAVKSAHEHLIVFADANRSTQIWQWVRREPGKPIACREHTFHKFQSGDALIQKLEAIAFSLEEEESLTLLDVTRRAKAGFDVERITKRFYDRFKKEHTEFLEFITGIAEKTEHEWYASVMLNRLMFVYFIQRKGFLDGDPDYLRNRLARMRREHGQDCFYSFYRYFLLRLFHEGLGGKARTPELEKLLGKIPYFDGGFFERHPVELRYPDIKIPDEAFERIFDYFDEYNWHLDERPLRADNEINPDVLGYIFEKYINQKQMGAYYTKEDITEYISKNTVIPFLFDAARSKCKVAFENPGGPAIWNLLSFNPDRYLYPAVKHGVIKTDGGVLPETDLPGFVQTGMHDPQARMFDNRYNLQQAPASDPLRLVTETWREYVCRRNRCLEIREKLQCGKVQDINDLITLNLDIRQFAQDAIENCEGPDLLRAFWHTINGHIPDKSNEKHQNGITILDPTCGSGAFLFAALNILEPLYEACLDRMEAFVEDLGRSSEKHRPEKYSDFRKILKQVDDHPNRRYYIFKNIILNNLFGVDIMEEAVEICKLRLFLKLVAQVEPDSNKENFGIEPLPDIDFNIRSGNTLVGYATTDEVRKIFKEDPQGQAKLQFGEVLSEFQKFEEQVELTDRTFKQFRRIQTVPDTNVKDLAGAKQNLRERLKTLDDELNRHLASEYGVKVNKKADYDKWLKSHQPFHWFVEFYGIMQTGGFDVIIGNPPYVEYRKVRDAYLLPREQYVSEAADNLYAFCMERSGILLRSSGWFGMIVPAGVLGLEETLSMREVILRRFNNNWFSTYSIRPSRLFDGVDQRLCICLETQKGKDLSNIQSTQYQHWNVEERNQLFPKIEYGLSFFHGRLNRILQIGRREGTGILQKIELKTSKTADYYYSRSKNGFLIHYHRSPRYWIRAMDFDQYFKSPTRNRSVHHFRDTYFADMRIGKFVGALMNSTLFFFWFVSVGNGRNITGTDVKKIPVGNISDDLLAVMTNLFDTLMRDYKNSSFIRERQDCEFQEFRPSLSKPIIDQIDQALAKHYGFTDEELDFIINYDIKYRMGRGTDSGEEDD